MYTKGVDEEETDSTLEDVGLAGAVTVGYIPLEMEGSNEVPVDDTVPV